MNREFHEALSLYLTHCNSRRLFVLHPLDHLSQVIDGDWHLRDEKGLVAIVTKKGNVGSVCTQHSMATACPGQGSGAAPGYSAEGLNC